MSLDELAKALGGTTNGDWINVAGPGHSGDDRSLGFRFDANAPDGFVVNSLAGDDPTECRNYVTELLLTLGEGGIPPIQSETSASGETCKDQRLARAMELWEQATPFTGTNAETYLASRGCAHAEITFFADELRFHPHCPFGSYRFPAMLGLMRDVITGKPVGVHRTALKDDGTGKRTMPAGMNAKMMMGTAKRAAVQLHPGASQMGIAEGIETALSAHTIFGIPVWAVLSAPGIAAFPVITGTKKLTIFADHDLAGLKAAQACACRYWKARIEGRIQYPKAVGTDWNDYLEGAIAK